MEPKYIVISNEIIQRIKVGAFQPGDRIPSENELIKKYNISNTTARKCLSELEKEGWVNRIKGKGTFVINRSKSKFITRTLGSFQAIQESFSTNLKREGLTPKNIILEKTVFENGFSSSFNNQFLIIEGPVLKIHRLRYGNKLLLKDEIRFISLNLCPKINLLDLDTSLLKIYEEDYHLQLENVERTLSTAIADPKDATNHFGNDEPIATFILNGVVICNNNKVVEIEKSIYRGDKYKFSVSAKPVLSIGKKTEK